MESLRTLLGLDEFICGKDLQNLRQAAFRICDFSLESLHLWHCETEKFNSEQLKSRIKRKASTLINGLKFLNITKLATRRNRGDIIQIYIKNPLYKWLEKRITII